MYKYTKKNIRFPFAKTKTLLEQTFKNHTPTLW